MLALTLVIMAAIVGLRWSTDPCRERALQRILISTQVWFIKFLPLFIILFPIHKAMWFEEKDFDGPIPAGAGAGGNLFDYLLCRKSCRYPGGYVKDDRPRCVQPETHNVSRPSIRSIVGRVPRRGLLDDAALRLDLRHDGPPRGLQAARGRTTPTLRRSPKRSARGPATLSTTRRPRPTRRHRTLRTTIIMGEGLRRRRLRLGLVA